MIEREKLEDSNFAKWLKKEYSVESSDADSIALVTTTDKKELIKLIRSQIPGISLERMSGAIHFGKKERVEKNLEILKENGLPLDQSVSVLIADPKNVEKNLEILKENGLPLDQSIRMLSADPKNVEKNLEILKENGLPLDQSVAVLGSNPKNVEENIEIINRNGIPVKKVIDLLRRSPKITKELISNR